MDVTHLNFCKFSYLSKIQRSTLVWTGQQCGRWQVRAGYELTHWMNLVNEPDFVDDVNEGKLIRRLDDFSLDGMFLQMGVGW